MNPLYKDVLTSAPTFINLALRDLVYRLHGVFHETLTMQTQQGRITMSTRDDGLAAKLFRRRQYEYDASLRALHLLKTNFFAPQKDVVLLDVGANIGIISTGLLLAHEIDYAIAIEPEPRIFELLIKNIIQNGLLEKTLCLPIALGATHSMLTLELSPVNQGDHRIRSTPVLNAIELHNETARLTIQVPALSLDELLAIPEISRSPAAKPSLLWIDVQGYEGHIFAGGKEFLSTGIPAVAEIWPYALLRSGMSLKEFTHIVTEIWSDYWVERDARLIRYPVSVFDRYLEELGTTGYSENVIFTP